MIERAGYWSGWVVGCMCAGIVAGMLPSGCRRTEDAPTVARPPNATRPVMPDVAAGTTPIPTDIEAIPDLGSSTAQKMRDGEIWQKFPSGLLIFEVRRGNGRRPQLGETVHVTYVGTFPDGKVFDKATKDNPFTFRLGTKNIIKGWNLGLSTMQVGGKRRIWLPANLAYGERGSGATIPANMPLIFEIELLDISGEAVELPAAATQAESSVPLVKPIGPVAPGVAPGK